MATTVNFQEGSLEGGLYRIRLSDPALAGSQPIGELQGDMLDKATRELEQFCSGFEHFFANEVVPQIDRIGTRAGVVDQVALFRGTVTDIKPEYLVLVGGLLGGSVGAAQRGKVIEQIQQSYQTQVEVLGEYREVGRWQL